MSNDLIKYLDIIFVLIIIKNKANGVVNALYHVF